MSDLEHLQKRCDDFNATHKNGDVIRVRRIAGESETVERTITYGAHVLGGHSAVVYVSGGGGCWDLSHVVEPTP
jgi:hypothetical protein